MEKGEKSVMALRGTGALLLLALLAACGGPRPYGGVAWDGRRGYDGHGDYGYDLAASRAEAGAYRARASRVYAVPGTPDDPWGPHIREASTRFGVPENWVREVMRQESGGRLYGADGSPITSSAGAMGLMQVMPGTYDRLRARHGLGADPYEPRDNILAGTAYLRDMHDRFGFPHFLAAYNAGPERVALYLTGATILPDETENYLASIVPRLNTAHAATAPGSAAPLAMAASARPYDDPSDRAFEGGGLVTASAPTGSWTPAPTLAPLGGGIPSATAAEHGPGGSAAAPRGWPSPASGAPSYRLASAPVGLALAAPARVAGREGWGIQVGAFPDPATSRRATAQARARAASLLANSAEEIMPVSAGGTLYRARLVGLSPGTAQAACATLSGGGMPCFTVPPAGF